MKTLSESELTDLETTKKDIERSHGVAALEKFTEYMNTASTEHQELEFSELIYIGTLISRMH